MRIVLNETDIKEIVGKHFQELLREDGCQLPTVTIQSNQVGGLVVTTESEEA